MSFSCAARILLLPLDTAFGLGWLVIVIAGAWIFRQRRHADRARAGSIVWHSDRRAFLRASLDTLAVILFVSSRFAGWPRLIAWLSIGVALGLVTLEVRALAEIRRGVRLDDGFVDFGIGDQVRERRIPPRDPYRGIEYVAAHTLGSSQVARAILKKALLWDAVCVSTALVLLLWR